MGLHAFKSFVSGQPVLFSLSVIFPSQGEAEQSGTLLLWQIDSQKHDVRSSDRLNSQTAVWLCRFLFSHDFAMSISGSCRNTAENGKRKRKSAEGKSGVQFMGKTDAMFLDTGCRRVKDNFSRPLAESR